MSALILCCFVIICISMIFAEEESISINKPIVKNQLEPWVHFSTDYVRCFCNLPACVSTGYMCKSSGGGCFSDLLSHTTLPPQSAYEGRHGCLELLTDKEQRKRCEHVSSDGSQQNKKHPKSLFLCCHHDMCNHVDSPQTKNLINNTLLMEIMEDSDSHKMNHNNAPEQFLYSNSEVWFRAATIAVPICGAVILFVLIALAVKILRNENESCTDDKLRPSMYVHHMNTQRKTSCEKYSHDYYDRNYDNMVIHCFKNSFYSNPVEENEVGHKQQIPLLLQNEAGASKNVNETNGKLHLSDDYLINDQASYILELKKETVECPEVNIVKFNNSDKKYGDNNLDKS